MRRLIIYLICGILLFMAPSQVHGQPPAADTGFVVLYDIVYKSIIVSSEDTARLALDLYTNASADNHMRPAILFVHGGGFWEGDKRSTFYQQMATAFAQQGYVAISVNYRLKKESERYSGAVLDTCIADVMDAVKWIRRNNAAYKVDTARLFICGDSAGGAIAVNASYHPENHHYFMGCIDLWGGLPGKNGWDYPIYSDRLFHKTPPTCIVQGTDDRIVPVKTSMQLQEKLVASGIRHQLLLLKKADHYPVERTEEIASMTIAFTNKILSSNK